MNSLKTVDKLQLGHLSQCEHYPGTSQKTGCNWSHCSFIDYFLWLLSMSGRKEGKENKFNMLRLCKSSGCAGLYWLHSLQTGRILVLSVWLLWTEGPQQQWLLPFASSKGAGMSEKCFIKAREGDCCSFKAGICLRLVLCAIKHGLGISSSPPSTTLHTLAKTTKGSRPAETLVSFLPAYTLQDIAMGKKGKRGFCPPCSSGRWWSHFG